MATVVIGTSARALIAADLWQQCRCAYLTGDLSTARRLLRHFEMYDEMTDAEHEEMTCLDAQ